MRLSSITLTFGLSVVHEEQLSEVDFESWWSERRFLSSVESSWQSSEVEQTRLNLSLRISAKLMTLTSGFLLSELFVLF